MCLFHVSFQNWSGSDRVPAHDEFTGARKVSPLDRAMRMSGFIRLRRTAAHGAIGICVLGLIAAASASAAEDASPWDGDARSAVRLIAGSAMPGKVVRAGVEIKLKSGWHTYWRYPGDAGVPPRFDFTESQNVKTVDVLWPAPQPIPEHDLVTIGYTGDVILPLAVVPENAAKPVKLRLKLDYAVCAALCVPAEGKAELELTAGPSSQDAALAAAEARVPKKTVLGEGSALAIKSVRREDGAGRRRDACRSPRRPVRRGTDAGLGAAGAEGGRWRTIRLATFCLRARRRPAGSDIRWRPDRAHRNRGEHRNRGRHPSRLIRPAR